MIKRFVFPPRATSISDCSDLIPSWVHSLQDLNRVETENILKAQLLYLKSTVSHPRNWFNVRTLRTIHRTMLDSVWEWAMLKIGCGSLSPSMEMPIPYLA